MISHDPNERQVFKLFRSNCEQVLGHLFFWSNNKRIQFLQDFSNYIEDISYFHPHIVRLEQNSLEIVRGSWSFHIPRRILEGILAVNRFNLSPGLFHFERARSIARH